MTRILPLAIAFGLLAFGERKPLPGQAGNDDIELTASPIIDRDEIKDAIGADLGEGYVVMRVTATPKTDHPLRIGPDDFTVIYRKDGQRSQPLAPSQIAGSGGSLVVKSAPADSGARSPGWNIGGFGGIGNAAPAPKGVDSKIETSDGKAKDSPLLAALKDKVLPDKETSTEIGGLLYFPLDGKIKAKDLAIVYKGPAGRLLIEFPEVKSKR